MDTVCNFCSFLDHTKDTCPTLQDRRLLAGGLPVSAPSCEHHSNILRELEKATGDSASNWSTVLQTPATAGLIHDNVTSETALFPICSTCTRSELGATDFEIPEHIDICCCASKIVASACWYCELERIQSKKLNEIQKRMNRTDLGSGMVRAELLCHCGEFVPKPEKARKCVGCYGLVTTPFRNFAGDKVVFAFAMPNIQDVRFAPSSSACLHNGDSGLSEDHQDQNGQEMFGEDSAGISAPDHSIKSKSNNFQQKENSQASVSNLPQRTHPANDEVADAMCAASITTRQQKVGTGSSSGVIDSVISGNPAHGSKKTPTPSGMKDIFVPYQVQRINDIGLEIPEEGVPIDTKLTPGKKMDLLMRANHLKKIQIRTLPTVLEICGFPSPMIDAAASKIREDLRQHGEMPKCLGVLYVMRQRGWAGR